MVKAHARELNILLNIFRNKCTFISLLKTLLLRHYEVCKERIQFETYILNFKVNSSFNFHLN